MQGTHRSYIRPASTAVVHQLKGLKVTGSIPGLDVTLPLQEYRRQAQAPYGRRSPSSTAVVHQIEGLKIAGSILGLGATLSPQEYCKQAQTPYGRRTPSIKAQGTRRSTISPASTAVVHQLEGLKITGSIPGLDINLSLQEYCDDRRPSTVDRRPPSIKVQGTHNSIVSPASAAVAHQLEGLKATGSIPGLDINLSLQEYCNDRRPTTVDRRPPSIKVQGTHNSIVSPASTAVVHQLEGLKVTGSIPGLDINLYLQEYRKQTQAPYGRRAPSIEAQGKLRPSISPASTAVVHQLEGLKVAGSIPGLDINLSLQEYCNDRRPSTVDRRPPSTKGQGTHNCIVNPASTAVVHQLEVLKVTGSNPGLDINLSTGYTLQRCNLVHLLCSLKWTLQRRYWGHNMYRQQQWTGEEQVTLETLNAAVPRGGGTKTNNG